MEENPPYSKEELAAAEELRRWLQERLGAEIPNQSREEVQKWFELDSGGLSELAAKTLGEANYEGIVEELRKAVDAAELFSPYDEPLTRTIIKHFCEEIETACHELGIPLRSGVAYGSTTSLETEAARYSVFFTEARVTTFRGPQRTQDSAYSVPFRDYLLCCMIVFLNIQETVA